ncbi:MAG TPA: chromosome segregation protein SMC, partial [Lactobacillus sp.]|nr:chromosome segregation protein SMC [Lactobacillus sp.]
MKLKALEISGFKSFADKTKIEFMPGMTGIVGPNGSGKSNIIEAIRWVLGEQSARDLRGTKMTDVIFAGAANRKPLNRAEVSITFENSDHYLKSDFSEVRVTRRLFRNGESEYRINGNQCRLRDVVNLFMDTGLGRESFSIISQGRVESVINNNPEDRRTIIEEVAGIYKYKQNKNKAQKELATTHDNLNRVNDIIAELESQMEPLAEQSALAKDYLDQKHRYDELDKSRLVIEIKDNRRDKHEVDQRMSKSKTLVTDYEQQVKNQTATVTAMKTEQAKLFQQKDELQDQQLSLTQQVERLTGQQTNANTKTAYQQQQLSEITHGLSETQAQIKQVTSENEQLRQAIETQQQAVKQATDVVDALKNGQNKHQQVQLEAQINQLQDQYITQMQTLTTLHNERHYLERNHEQGGQNREHLASQTAAMQRSIQTLMAQKKELATQLTTSKQQQRDLHEQFKNDGQRYHKLTAEFEAAQKNWYNALAVQQRAKARADSLAALNDEHAGFYQGVKAILNHRAQFSGLVGSVADLITVPKTITKAIETALGAQLQQLVVRDELTARDAVHFLTAQRAGRATFLPLTTIRGRRLTPAQLDNVAHVDGFIGLAAELITFDAQLRGIVDHLLGTTVVATNLDAAIAIAKIAGHRFRIVTQDGQVMNASGSITGGANRNAQVGLLSQRSEHDDLETAIAQMQTKLDQQEKHVADLQSQLDTSNAAGSKLRDTLNATDAEVQHQEGSLSLLNDQLTEANRKLTASQYEQQQQDQDASDYQTQIDTNEQKTTATTQQLADIKSQREQAQRDLTTLTADDETKANQRQEKMTWLATAQAQLASKKRDLSRGTQSLGELNKRKQAQEERLTNLQTSQSDAGSSMSDVATQLKQAQNEVKRVAKALVHANARLTELSEQLATGDSELTRIQGLQRVSLSEMNDLSARQSRLATLLDNDLNTLSDTYELSFEDANSDLSDLNVTEIKKQLKLLKRGLDEIGDVNVGAIEEYQRVSERYDFLARQQSDLITSQQQLQETMTEMDGEVQTRFKQSFDEVAKSFSKIFVQMFGGGQAKLVLTDPEHLLTTGIDIMAQP